MFIFQMYLKALSIRRNEPLKLQSELKEQDHTIQGFVKFPASLMIKRAGERKYSLEKDLQGNLHPYFTFSPHPYFHFLP